MITILDSRGIREAISYSVFRVGVGNFLKILKAFSNPVDNVNFKKDVNPSKRNQGDVVIQPISVKDDVFKKDDMNMKVC